MGPNTSHVVTGEGKRTLNLLKGLLQGCWIVSKVSLSPLSTLLTGHWLGLGPGLSGGRPLGGGGDLRDDQLQSGSEEDQAGEEGKQWRVQVRTVQRYTRDKMRQVSHTFVVRCWVSVHQQPVQGAQGRAETTDHQRRRRTCLWSGPGHHLCRGGRGEEGRDREVGVGQCPVPRRHALLRLPPLAGPGVW